MPVSTPDGSFADHVERGERFGFGQNLSSFLRVVDAERIAEAKASLRQMLQRDDLTGLTFLDVGSGSRLFSLAAAELSAARVHSFDFDPNSVACTEELRRRFGPLDADSTVEQGSVLDAGYVRSLGRFDIVYAWGVLHHTGDMWPAIENVTHAVAEQGSLFLSIYNDQGPLSGFWKRAKRIYNELPRAARLPFMLLVVGPRELKSALGSILRGRPLDYARGWTKYKSFRSMSPWHDLVDRIGGYPFEVATPERVFDFVRARDFALDRLKTRRGGLGCNELVFLRTTS
jgi:2-polyprenyl-3-methyl-5-hydroxy-6-metoxy-1,4-benzoquinol methylase